MTTHGMDELHVPHNWKLLIPMTALMAFVFFVPIPLSFVDDYEHGKLSRAGMIAWIAGSATVGIVSLLIVLCKPLRKEPIVTISSLGVGTNIYPLRPLRWTPWKDVLGFRIRGKGSMSALIICFRRRRKKRLRARWLRRLRASAPAIYPRQSAIVVPCVFLGTPAIQFVMDARCIHKTWRRERSGEQAEVGR